MPPSKPTSFSPKHDADDAKTPGLLPPAPIAAPQCQDNNNKKDEQPSLPPSVTTVILHHHLGHISDENGMLRGDNERMKAVREILTSMKIDNDNGEIISGLSLADSAIVPQTAFDVLMSLKILGIENVRSLVGVPFHSVPAEQLEGRQLLLLLRLSGAKATPLSDLASIKVIRGNQRIGGLYGYHGIHRQIPVFDEPNPIIFLSGLPEAIMIQGKITGLSDRDLGRFRDGSVGVDTIHEFVRAGAGLENPENIMFTPFSFFMNITPGLVKVLKLLPPMCRENPSSFAGEEIEYELSRRNIIAAIGGYDSTQMKLLEENKALKFENAALEALGDILGTVEIPCSAGALTFHLRGGELVYRRKLLWQLDLSGNEDLTLSAKDLCHSHPTLLGVPMHFVPPRTYDVPFVYNEDKMVIRLEYSNGTMLYGVCDNSVQAADFPDSDASVKLTEAILDFDLIKEALGALGAVDADAVNYKSTPPNISGVEITNESLSELRDYPKLVQSLLAENLTAVAAEKLRLSPHLVKALLEAAQIKLDPRRLRLVLEDPKSLCMVLQIGEVWGNRKSLLLKQGY